MNSLESLKQITKVVADSASIDYINYYCPEDVTTNPSLMFQVFKMSAYAERIEMAVSYACKMTTDYKERVEWALDKLSVLVGAEILSKIKGRVSIEVSAKLAHDKDASIAKARRLIELFAEEGFGKSRLYIKLPATWEGIQAAKVLEAEGICCNLTLLFSFAQAVACAQANVSLISPFVGRILDWHKKTHNREYTAEEDPGVLSVTKIYNYYKKHGYKTIVMGASFRNTGEIFQLAGCDNLTISPTLLEQLEKQDTPVPRKLSVEHAMLNCTEPCWEEMTEEVFYQHHNADVMAVEKLKEGIDNFAKDTLSLEQTIAERTPLH